MTPDMDLTDFDQVLRAARAGDEQAWTELYVRFAGPVLGYLRGRGAAEPEDLLGEIFLQVVRNIDSFSGDLAGFKSWLFTIAYRRLIDERRARTRRPTEPVADPEPPPTTESPESVAVERVGEEEVIRILGQLPPNQRDVLVLRLIGDLTIPEIAQILDKSQGAVKALQRRALHNLRPHLRRGVPL